MVSAGDFWPSQQELSRCLKYMARARIPEFESCMPSQAVRSLGGMSGLEKCFPHFRGLVRHYRVSEQLFLDLRPWPTSFAWESQVANFQFPRWEGRDSVRSRQRRVRYSQRRKMA